MTELTSDERENKLKARRILALPVKEQPDSTVFYTPGSSTEYARYRVVFGSRVVCFQHVNGRYMYKGEYHLARYPDLVAFFASQIEIEASETRIDEALRDDEAAVNQDRYERACGLLETDPSADLDTCGRCRTFMLASNGEVTVDGFRCDDCLETIRKFDTLTEAVGIVRAAAAEAYPVTDTEAFTVTFSSSSFISITKHMRKEHGREIPIGGFSDAASLASDLLHRIKRNSEREAQPIGWIKGNAYRDLSVLFSIAEEYGLDEVYDHLKTISHFDLTDKPKSVMVVPCKADGTVHTLWLKSRINPLTVPIRQVIPESQITWQ